MKNITLSINEETYRQSRIKAAEAGTSVSALVRAFLTRLVQGQSTETDFDRLKRLQDETIALIRANHPGFSAADRLTRDQIHDRDALR